MALLLTTWMSRAGGGVSFGTDVDQVDAQDFPVLDAGGNFIATDLEGALAELASSTKVLGTLTKTFTNGESYTINLDGTAAVPNISVLKDMGGGIWGSVVLGTDYNVALFGNDQVKITSLAAQNLKVKVRN